MYKIAIIGEQCAGKTTVAQSIQRYFDGAVVIKYASPHYGVLHILGKEKNRSFMQEFSDLAKKHFGQDCFLKSFEKNVGGVLMNPQLKAISLMVCDDVRYKAELELCQKLGFITIFVSASTDTRVRRARALNLDFITDHNSETEVPGLQTYCDYIVQNNGDKDALEREIWRVVAGLQEQEKSTIH